MLPTQPTHSTHRSKSLSIDAALLERMGVLARLNPGSTVSLARLQTRCSSLRQKVTLHVDGVAADEMELPPHREPNDAA